MILAQDFVYIVSGGFIIPTKHILFRRDEIYDRKPRGHDDTKSSWSNDIIFQGTEVEYIDVCRETENLIRQR